MCGPSYAGISIYMYQCFLIGIIFLVLHIGYDKLHHDLSIVQVNCMRLIHVFQVLDQFGEWNRFVFQQAVFPSSESVGVYLFYINLVCRPAKS